VQFRANLLSKRILLPKIRTKTYKKKTYKYELVDNKNPVSQSNKIVFSNERETKAYYPLSTTYHMLNTCRKRSERRFFGKMSQHPQPHLFSIQYTPAMKIKKHWKSCKIVKRSILANLYAEKTLIYTVSCTLSLEENFRNVRTTYSTILKIKNIAKKVKVQMVKTYLVNCLRYATLDPKNEVSGYVKHNTLSNT
jgi:hypothetical protein